MFIAPAMCGVMSARVAALCSSCSLQIISNADKQAALNEAGRSVSVVTKRPTITIVELHTFHL